MIRYGKIWIAAILSAATLLGAVGCDRKTEEPITVAGEPERQNPAGEDTVSFLGEDDPENELPVYLPHEEVESSEPTATPKPYMATPKPDVTPLPTREPVEGDIATDRFPAYDTGEDADWSYQSDELRVAIRKYENTEDQIVYYVADLWVRNISSFRTELAHGKFNSGREDPEDFASRVNAVFGISGTMNAGLVIHNGEQIKKNIDSSDIAFRSGILIVYRDGSVRIIDRTKKEKYNYNTENKKNGGVLHALQFGPVLVQDGQIRKGLKQRERHPRILFGYLEPGHYIAVAVDGRTKKSVGMTEQECAELMQSIGCVSAINLDGGNSAVMLFMGKTINVPSGQDRDGDGVAGRNIVDMLAFAEFDAEGNAPALSDIPADRVHGE